MGGERHESSQMRVRTSPKGVRMYILDSDLDLPFRLREKVLCREQEIEHQQAVCYDVVLFGAHLSGVCLGRSQSVMEQLAPFLEVSLTVNIRTVPSPFGHLRREVGAER